MENNIQNEEKKIKEKWLNLAWRFGGLILIFALLVKRPIESITIYGQYYGDFIISVAIVPGIPFFILGYFYNKIQFYLKFKQYSKLKLSIGIASFVLVISSIVMINGETIKCCKDIKYIIQSTYCEQVEDLKDIYIKKSSGKYTNVNIHIYTENHKFIPSDYIVEEYEFEKFKQKFKNAEKVKIKYLPNTEILLGIEPVLK